jgi:hypothetical protein
MTTQHDALIEAQDFNALLRAVDAACERHAWDELVDLIESCEQATERGKQMWPIAAHIDYRLALEAPGEYAALALRPEVGRFAHGPLSEVAASSHTWAELADHIDAPQVAAYVAQERVLRGEDLRGDDRAHPDVLELPLVLESWEPTYALATFKATFVEVAEPWEPKAPLLPVQARPGARVDDPELTDALLDLVAPWSNESNGAARAVAVEGTAKSAAATLTFGGLRVGELTPAEALQRMAWAAASGGARGRRRGAALGRFLAWYVASLVCGIAWPAAPDELGKRLQDTRWHRWDEGDHEDGWVLRLAVESPAHRWAAAVGATDVLDDEGADAPP